jgi:outer membrane protein TolC
MLRNRLLATLLLLLAVIPGARAEAPAVEGTLPEDYLPQLRTLLKTAVERSPTAISANIGVASAEAQKYMQAAALWPQISAGLSYQDNRQSVAQGVYSSISGFYYNTNLNQPLFQWRALKNQADIAALGKRIAERNYAEAYRQLAVTLRIQYMGLVGKKMTLRNARYADKMAKEALATEQAKVDSGAASDAELLGYKLAVEQSSLDADRSADDFAYAKRVFARLVGLDSLDDGAIADAVPHPVFSEALADTVLTGFVGSGIESTFQSEVYAMRIRQQELNYDIAKVRLLPKLSAAASYNYNPQIAVGARSVQQYGVSSEDLSLTANWSIFDGFATRGNKLNAQAAKRAIEREKQTYVDSTIDAISEQRHQLGFAARAMALAEVRANLAESGVKKLNEDVKLGYASPVSVENSTLNFYNQELGAVGARADLLGRWSDFVSTAGIDPAVANLQSRYVH